MEGFVDVSAVLRQVVYILLHHGTVVYVGKAKVGLGRLYTHRVAWGKKSRKPISGAIPAKGMLFDQIMVRPCMSIDIDALEALMIERYRPRYNTQLKSSIPPELIGLVSRIVAQRGIAPALSPRIERRGF